MTDHTVARRGTDSSGRGIYASGYMWAWWLDVCDRLGFTPTITQGAWMTLAGGGAQDSAGYHDGGACFDLRVWDLTTAEQQQTIRELRRQGAAAWLRDVKHGGFTDPHIHLVLGTDHDLADGAAYQWRDYINGGDGMGGRDYHWRPDPLVTTPPEDDMTPEQSAQLQRIENQNDAILKRLAAQGAIRVRLAKLVEQGQATKKELADLQRDLETLTDG
jgi:hypothetical protein